MSEQKDRPDKEAIARTIFFHGEDEDTDKWNCLRPNQREVYLKIAKQIIALFPDRFEVGDEFVKAFARDYKETHEALHKIDIEEAHKEGYEQAVKNIKTPEAEALVNEAIEEAKKKVVEDWNKELRVTVFKAIKEGKKQEKKDIYSLLCPRCQAVLDGGVKAE